MPTMPEVVTAALFAKVRGAVSTVKGKTAPLPGCDASELPLAFVASTLVETMAPSARLQGAAFRVAIVTEQVQLAGQLIDATLQVTAV